MRGVRPYLKSLGSLLTTWEIVFAMAHRERSIAPYMSQVIKGLSQCQIR